MSDFETRRPPEAAPGDGGGDPDDAASDGAEAEGLAGLSGDDDGGHDTAGKATERPTVVPPFDVETFARNTGTSLVPPPRPTLPTLSDEAELEFARLRSMAADSNAPPPPGEGRRYASGSRAALSLADARSVTPSAFEGASFEGEPIDTAVMPPPHDPEYDDAPELEVHDSSIPRALQDPVLEMKDRFNLGDFTGALSLAESILLREPANAEALRLAEECQRVLIKMYAAKIGPLDRVPTLNVQPPELRWLSMDHRAGFLLSLVDGSSSIEMILDLSGMPLLDTLRILHELYQQRIISFRA